MSKQIIKKYQVVGDYSFSEIENDEDTYGYDTMEDAIAAASLGHRSKSYIVEIKSVVKPVVKPSDVTVEEFN